MSHFHIGRSWSDTRLEDTCPCPKAPCGLIANINIDPSCDQHRPMASRTMRQGHLAHECEHGTAASWAIEQLLHLDTVIDYMASTSENTWRTGTVRSADGSTNCFFGHLFNMAPDDEHANALWGQFEEAWATTYAIYPVNDGTNPRYQQATAKQRVLAYLRALQSGDELTTHQSMEVEYAAYLAATELAVDASDA